MSFAWLRAWLQVALRAPPRVSICVSLPAALMFCLMAQAAPAGDDALAGRYRVKGECAIKAENGTYQPCLAWNVLALKRLDQDKRYAFTLETNTFAATQGQCTYEGTFQLSTIRGKQYLVRPAPVADGCHLRVRITPRWLTLEVPESEEYEACKSGCGINSTLYSDPFPRGSKRAN